MILRRRLLVASLLVVMLALSIPSPASGFEVNFHHTTIGGFGGTPFWLQASRWGLSSDSPLQSSLGVEGSLERDLGQGWGLEILADVDAFADDDGFKPRVRFAYGGVSWRFLEFKGGLYPDTVGILPSPELSTGSMSVSGNARPLPKVQIAIPDWTAVPFTNEALEVQGGLAHGQFLGERVVNDALLHEKWGYARLGPRDGSKVYLGLVHQVMWGGEFQQVTWANYQRAFLGREASEDSSELGPAGNGLGMWDLGIEMPLDRIDLHAYYHHYFELKHGIVFKNALDGLWGLRIGIPVTEYWPDTIVVESLKTVYQGGRYHRLTQVLTDAGFDPSDRTATFGIGGGSHQYYSHGIYRNGWTHLDRVVGNPLIVATGTGEDLRIASNRVNANHFGFSGALANNVRYLGKITFANHKPTRIGARTYAPISLVPEGETWLQWTTFLGIDVSNAFGNQQLTASIGIAGDWGDVYENTFGMELAFRHSLNTNESR